MILPAVSALPSTDSVTSNSCSLRLLALTLIWMLIWGGWLCCWSELGAFGFSNERSLVYCARTLSWGAWAASGGVPLPLVIECLLTRLGLNFAAAGYHRATSFHKDERSRMGNAGHGHNCGVHPAGPAQLRLKRLKMRDFRAGSGFLLRIKRATLGAVPKGAIGRARFRAYIPRT